MQHATQSKTPLYPKERVFHVSDNPDIVCFEPREVPVRSGQTGRLVWGIGERLLHNYLLPRDCPRVTYYVGGGTVDADAERFFGQTAAQYVVAIESRWLPAVQTASLYVYELPVETFTVIDETANYYGSRAAVRPLNMTTLSNLPQSLTARSVELRVTPSLWPLRDAVADSTLAYSIIRMRNAVPRGEVGSKK